MRTKSTFWLALVWLVGLMIFVSPGYAQERKGEAYIVQHNDYLWKLAEKYLGDGNAYSQIVAATAAKAATDSSFVPIVDPNLLYPGQKIWIPAVSTILVTSPTETTTGQENTPAASVTTSDPTGHIAFSFWNNSPTRCTYEVNIVSVPDCLQGATQCQATRRIMSLNNISEPALSPDGSRLAFRGWGEPSSPDSPFSDCAPAHPHRFLGHTTLDATEFTGFDGFWEDAHPDWSPDGNRILFDSGRNGDGIIRLMLINADGSGEEELRLAGQQPSWAPDNQRLVCRGCDLTGNRCGLWLAMAAPVKSWEVGHNLIAPVIEEPEAAQPDWSPMADEIVYQSPVSGSWDLYLINADGSDRRQLTNSPGVEGLPSWSPDGRWIAYVNHDGQNWSLRVISRNGTDDRLIFVYDGGMYALPKAVEPYGQRDWLNEQISWSQ
ncbi:MAG: PD40 domain-containing protein [Anaerolineae bacterium]|nr:PD40 domain-containing protein [Anaerolineae bacterium]